MSRGLLLVIRDPNGETNSTAGAYPSIILRSGLVRVKRDGGERHKQE